MIERPLPKNTSPSPAFAGEDRGEGLSDLTTIADQEEKEEDPHPTLSREGGRREGGRYPSPTQLRLPRLLMEEEGHCIDAGLDQRDPARHPDRAGEGVSDAEPHGEVDGQIGQGLEQIDRHVHHIAIHSQ